jgi:hypothetical protein
MKPENDQEINGERKTRIQQSQVNDTIKSNIKIIAVTAITTQ